MNELPKVRIKPGTNLKVYSEDFITYYYGPLDFLDEAQYINFLNGMSFRTYNPVDGSIWRHTIIGHWELVKDSFFPEELFEL